MAKTAGHEKKILTDMFILKISFSLLYKYSLNKYLLMARTTGHENNVLSFFCFFLNDD